jgi:hypothetical protein
MAFNTLWLVVWAAITAPAVYLLVSRLLTAKQDLIRIAPADTTVAETLSTVDCRLTRLDHWGKLFTGASILVAVLPFVVSLVWALVTLS